MKHKNTFVKKLTALVLCLCMVLPMVTTGFAPMMALLESIVPEAEAAVAGIKIVVPETVYLEPKTGTTTTGQWYVNNNADGTVKKLDANGDAYSADDKAYVHITYPNARLTSLKASVGSTELTLPTSITGLVGTTFGTSATSGNGAITLKTGLSAGETAVIEWTFVFDVNGKTKTHYAYTVAYAPYYQPVGAAAEAGSDQGWGNELIAWAGSVAWVSGVHGYATNNDKYPFVDNLGKLYYPTKSGFVPMMNKINTATTSRPHNAGLISESADCPDPTISYVQRDGGNYHRRTSAVSPYALITVDSSRYENFNQIPNLTVGFNVTDMQYADSGSRWYFADYTGYNANMENNSSGSSGNKDNNITNIYYNVTTGEKLAEKSEYSAGIKYNGTWDKKITAGTVQLVAALDSEETNGTIDRSAWNFLYVVMNVTTANKAALRQAVIDGSSYAAEDFTIATWNTYYTQLKAAAENLGNPTSSDVATTSLTNAESGLIHNNVTFDNMFDFTKFTIGGNLTLNERTSTGFTVTSTAADGNTGFSYPIAVEPGKTYIVSADAEFVQTSGGYDLYINTLDASYAGETTAVPDTSNGARREGQVYISLTGQTTNKTPYIRFTAGSNTAYITIRFDANAVGNKLTVNNIRICEDKGVTVTPANMYVTRGSKYGTLPIPTKTGYDFAGWVDENNNAVTADSIAVDGTLALYSTWTPKEYTITYDAKGGTVADSTLNFNINTELTFPKPEKEGYTFAGWMINATEGTLGQYNGGVVNADYNYGAGWTGNATFVAQWTPNTYTIYLEGNGSEGGATANMYDVVYDETVKLNKNGYTKNAYTFAGWNTAADGSGTSYADEAEVTKLRSGDKDTITLYAQWVPTPYTLTYDVIYKDAAFPTGSTGYTKVNDTTYIQEYDIEDSFYLLPAPTLTGYTFNYWKIRIADGNWQPVGETGGGGEYVKPNTYHGNPTIEADWRSNNYTIKFNANGGTGTMADLAMTYDTAKNLTVNTFTREGYDFAGWATLPNGTETTYTDGQSVSNLTASDGGVVTLYARWTPAKQELTVDTAGGVNGANLLYPDADKTNATLNFNPDGINTFSGGNENITYSGTIDEDGIDISGTYKVVENSNNPGNALLETTTMLPLWVYLEQGKTYEYSYTASNEKTSLNLFRDGASAIRASVSRHSGTTYSGVFVLGEKNAYNTGDTTWDTVADATGYYQLRMDQDHEMSTLDGTSYSYSISDLVIREVTPDAQSKYQQPNGSKIILNDPVRGGYTFGGWEFSGTQYGTLDGIFYTFGVNADTLVAKWNKNNYTLTYDANGGSLTGVNSTTYTADDTITIAAAPTRAGYTFNGWLVSDADGNWIENGTCHPGETASGMYGNVTLKAQWLANTVDYKVEHYKMNEFGSDYVLAETEYLQGETDTDADFSEKEYTGFAYKEAKVGDTVVTSATIAGDGTLVIELYYDREQYTVKVVAGSGVKSVSGGGSYYYDTKLAISAVPEEGYGNIVWKDADGNSIDLASYKVTGEVTLTASASANDVQYKVIHRVENADGTFTDTTETFTAKTDSSVSPDVNDYGAGFNMPSVQTVTVTGDGNTVVTYEYTRKEFTLTLDYGNGASVTGMLKYGATIDYPSEQELTKEGYSFVGWSPENITTMPAQDTLITAQWQADTYTISYDLADGSIDGTNPASYTVDTADFTLVNPTRRGYTFAGWTGTGLDETSTSVTVAKGSMGNRSYTATWTLNEYTITVDNADGTSERVIPYTVNSAAITIGPLTRTGYTFGGWTGTDLATAQQSITIDPATDALKDRTFVANWTANTNTVYKVYTYFMHTDGSYPTDVVPEVKTGTTGEKVTITPETVTGFTATTPSVSGDIKADGSLVLKIYYQRNQYEVKLTPGEGIASITGEGIEKNADGTYSGTFYYDKELAFGTVLMDGYENPTWDPEVPEKMPDRAINLTVRASVISYAISYDLNGGTVSANPQSYTVKTASFALNNPTRTGYTFAGWTGTDLDEASTSVTVEKGSVGDRAYTATWTPITYPIAYELNGGKLADGVTNPATYTIETDTFVLNNPTKVGYAFAGWTGTGLTEAAVQVEIATGSTGNREYTATWNVSNANYTVIYYTEDLGADTFSQLGETQTVGSTTGEKIVLDTLKTTIEGFTFKEATDKDGKVLTADPTVAADGSTIIKLYYTRNSHTLTYYITKGENETAVLHQAFENVEFGATIPTVVDPVRTGYSFQGWKEIDTVPTMPDSDLDILALWDPNVFTISYALDGGAFAADAVVPDKHTYDTTTPIPNPEKLGYDFAGWKTGDKELGKNYTVQGNDFTADFILTATWTPVEQNYTVEFYFMDTKGENYVLDASKTKTDKLATGEKLELTPETVTGFTLNTEKTVLDTPMPPEGNLVLKVYYDRNQFKLTLVAGDGIASVPEAKQYYYGAEVSFVASVKSGYDWSKWTNTADGADYSETNQQNIKMPASDLTLTANATPVIYTITVDTKGGVLESEFTRKTYIVTDEPIVVPDATKEGYIFNGWSLNGAAATTDLTIDPTRAVNVELVASWTAIEYTIIYNGAESAVNENPTVYTIETETFSLVEPTKTGYEFLGWTYGDVTEPTKDVTIGQGSTGKLEFTANWKALGVEYNIVCHFEGFTEGSYDSFINGKGSADAESDVTVADIVTEYDGFTFNDEKTVDSFRNGTTDGEVTVELYYTRNSYTITFDTDGGTEIAEETYKYNAAVTAPADPTKTGYTFGGWDKEIPATMPAENVTLKAQWDINKYTITFDTDGGGEVAPITQDYNTAVTAPADPTKTGYTFKGWSPAVPATMPAEDLTITATWEINKYTITFDTDGGSEVAPITQDYDTTVIAPADPTKIGYTFTGWDVTVPGTMPAEDLTITATWRVNKYTITFDSDGGSAVDAITQDYNTDVTAPADPTRTGYTFKGWDKDIPATMPAENVTLKAQWQVNQYTITFCDADGTTVLRTVKQDYGTTVDTTYKPSRTGYTFAGWDKAIPATMPAENITIIASWNIVKYNIVYILDAKNDEYVETNHADNPTTYTVEDNIKLKDPTKVGYTFTGWSPTGEIAKGSTGTQTFTATWEANKDTEYTIEYWAQTNDGIDYIPHKTVVFTGESDTTVTVVLEDIEGFRKPTNDTIEVYIKADGSTSVRVDYSRNQYTITFDTLGGTTVSPIKVFYDAHVSAPAITPVKTGYTFDGWDSLPEKMPAENITVTAKWTANSYEITYEGLENADEFAKTTAHTYGTATKIDKPTRNGYTFAGWVVNGAGDPVVDLTLAADGYTAPIALKAEWTANEQNYTVVYYYENLDGEYVESRRTTDNKAATDSPVTLTPATETGFTLNEDKSKLTGVIPVPGTTLELSVYYSRNSYTVTWDVEGVQKIETLKYGQTITKPADPTKTGYAFHAWNPEVPATMPAENKTFTAQFLAKTDTAYKVIHKIETLTDGMYEEKETENKIGTTASEVTPEVKTYEGFTAPQTKTVTIAADGSTVVEYLYTRNSYNVNIIATDAGLSNATATAKHKYGASVAVSVDVANGYAFKGWTSDNANVQGSNETNYTITVPASDVTLTAKAEIIKYTIGYELAGGALANDVTNPTEFYVTTEDFTLSNPEKRGYTFTGWTGSNGATAEKTVTVAKGTCQNLNYTANWQINQYTISYALNGGTVSVANPTGYTVESIAITLNNPTKAGYEFTGWTGTDLDGKVMNVTIDANSVGHREYTATWAPKTQTYYVDLYFMDLNGAYPETADRRIALTAKTAETVTYTMAEETGFTIVDGTNLTVVDGKNVLSGTIPATDLASEALVLEGYYSRDQHTVTLADGDGIVSVSGEGTYYYGASVTVNAELMPGYAWVNWSNTDGTYDAQEYSFPMGTADVSLTANAKIIEYQISYDYDGGVLAEGLTNPTTYTVNTDTITLVNPTRKGYTFLGWTGTDLSAYTTEVSIEKGALGNRSYKANWSVNTYTLTIDPNGGTYMGNAKATVLNFTVNDTIEIAEPTRVGYTFTGWSDGTTTSREITLQNVAEDRTYTAQWSADSNIKYTVEHYKMNLNGGYDLTASEKTVYENGVADGTVTPPVNAYTGFTSPEAQPVTVNPDGSTVVKYYYSRNKYTLTYKLFGEATSAKEYYFDAVVDSAPDTTVEGHTFAGWDKAIPSRMPAGDLVITGTWNINQYTITFNTVGGTAIEAITRNYGTDIIAPANPTKTGYTFAGWDVEIPATMPARNMTITANWTVNSYTITFNTDGGTEIAPITADYGTAITKPADPTKTGYTFGGWSVNIPTTMPAEDMTITALWNVNRYTVTFNTKGGTVIAPITGDYGDAIIAPADPTKRGYTFKGWDAEIPATVPAENVTINAIWEVITYDIFYINPNGSLVVDGKTNPTTYTVESTIKLNELTWAGYSFSGWVYRLDGQDSETTLENDTITNMVGNLTLRSMWRANLNDWYVDVYYMNTDGSYSNTPDKKLLNPNGSQQYTGYDVTYDLSDSRTLLAGFTPDTANSITTGIIPGTDELHLIAKYKRNQYTVTYDFANDTDKKVVTTWYEAALATVAEPTRTGYTFAGWYDAKGNKVDALPTKMPLNGGTYTAHWTANEYKLTFVENGGTEVADITYTIESTDVLPEITRAGYTFDGWLVTTAGGSWTTADANYAAGTALKGKYGDATLTAQWTARNDTTYVVKHMFMTVDGKSFVEDETKRVEATGTSDTMVTPAVLGGDDIIGFTAPAAKSVLIKADGTTVVEYKYTRNQYKLTWVIKGSADETITYYYGAAVAAKDAPNLPGHKFNGWSRSIPATMPAENVTITAKLDLITYYITIDYNGADPVDNKKEYNVETDTFTLTNPTRDGYTFLGWTGSNGTTAQTNITIAKGSTGDRSYKAMWNAENKDWYVDIYYMNTDGEYNDDPDESIKHTNTTDTNVSFDSDTKLKPGFTFDAEKSNLSGTVPGKGELRLTAKYIRNKYTVTYDFANGTDDKSVTTWYEASLATVADPVRTGYTFAGWKNSKGEIVTLPDTMPLNGDTYTAQWTADNYTLTLVENGGTAVEDIAYDIEDNVTLPVLTRDGYFFRGWKVTTEAGNWYLADENYAAGTPVSGKYGSATLTAQWTTVQYTLTFDTKGGTVSEASLSYTIEENKLLPAPVRPGYTFNGWNVTAVSNVANDSGNVSWVVGNTYAAGTSVLNTYGNATFEALWSPNTYTVTADTANITYTGANQATVDVDYTAILTPHAGYTLPETITVTVGGKAAIVNTDYIWTVNADGTATLTIKGASIIDNVAIKVERNIITYTISYDLDNATTDPGNATEYNVETAVTLTAPERKGYTFLGWTGSNGTTAQTNVSIPVGTTGDKQYTANWQANNQKWYVDVYYMNTEGAYNGTASESLEFTNTTDTPVSFDSDKKLKDGFVFDAAESTLAGTVPGEGTLRLTAKYIRKEYTVTYNFENGAENVSVKNFYEAKLAVVADPAKTGYTFAGWYDADGNKVDALPEKMPLNGGTYTAQWTANNYKLTLVENGGTAVEDITYTIESAAALPTISRAGYAFAGWRVTTAGGYWTTADASYIAGTSVNGKHGNATLTAQWTPVSYTLAFNAGKGTVAPASIAYTVEDATNVLPTPVRPGYTFIGWLVTAVADDTQSAGYIYWTVGQTYDAGMAVKGTYGNASFEAQWSANTYAVTADTANITYTGATTAKVDVDYTATLTPHAGYTLPDTITVSIGGKDAIVNTDYTWTVNNDGTATLRLIGASIIGNVEIKVVRKIIVYTINYSGLENSTLEEANKTEYTVETASFTLNNPTKLGYTFLGWTGTDLAEASDAVTIANGSVGNRAYTATWKANLNTCTVEHYQQNIYDNGYTLVDADTVTTQVETDQYFAPAVNTYTGFKSPEAKSEFVKGDGAVVIKYYYDRETYTVSIDGTKEGVASVSGAGTYRYGYEVTANATVSNGYAWAGWTTANNTTIGEQNYTFTIGTADVNLTANASIITYFIGYDLAGGSVATANPANYTVTTDTFTLVNPTRTGYEFLGWTGTALTAPTKTVTIANGSTGNKSYTANWQAIEYKVRYDLAGGTAQGENYTVYTIESPAQNLTAPVKTGYTFTGWTGSNGTTADKDVTIAGGSIGNLEFTANWSADTHTYKVETYVMTTGGQYLNDPDTVTDPINSATDEKITLTPDAREGFMVDQTLSKLTGVVDYEDKLVLKIYYSRNQYDLTLAANGDGISAVSPATKKVYYGAEVEILAAVAKGYTFEKWTSDNAKVADSAANPHKITMPAGNVNLTATATLNVYNINYFLNEGTNHANNPSTYTVLDEINIKQPTKLGYTFTGWTGTFNGMQVYIPAGETGDINLTANWQIDHYKITYDLAGGQLTEGKTNPEDYTVLDSFTLNNPERVGYTFNGWKGTGIDGVKTYVTVNEGKNTTGELAFTADWIADTDTKYTVNYWLMDIPSEVGVKTYTKDNDASFVGEATSDTDVTPQVLSYAGFTAPAAQTKNVNADGSTVFNFYYERNIYTYTFKADGYDDVVREYYYDYPVTAPSDPSRTGYEFKGWNPVVVDKMPAHNVVSVAQWKAISYNIGYALNGGTATNRTTYTIEDEVILTQPTKYGYTFLGWTGTDLTEPTLNVTIPAGTTGNRSYTANWEATRYEITYDLDGGTDNGENPISYTIEDTVTLVNPVKPGYRFLGWKGTGVAGMSSYVTFSEQTGNRTYTACWTVANNTPYTIRHHQQDIGANTYTLFEEESLTGTTNTIVMPKVKTYPGFTAPAAQTLTILADGSAVVDYFYTRNNYTIYFDSNGGTSVASQTYAFGETVVAPAAPSLLGYTFAGWTPALPETMTAGNLYLTASWKANSDTPYTVYHYYQDTDCVSYPDSLMETEYCHGETGAVVEVATRDKEGFTSPEKRTIVIAADGSRTVRYYYTRNTYTVTFVDHNDNILDLQSVVYGLPATPPVLADRAPDADGHYTFLGWSEDISFIHGYTTIKAMYSTEAHNPGADADCTQALVCTVCGYEIAPANGHMPIVQIPAVEPTCDKPGNTEDSVCSVCGEVISRYKVVPALGHDIGSWYVDVPATTTETGILKRVCSRCDWSEIHEIPVLSDTPVVSIDITTSGSQAYVGTTYQLVTSIKPSNAGNKQVLWESSDPSVASVTADGMITSHKPGEVTFTVTTLDGLKTDSITINFFYSADNYNLVVVDLFGCNLVMNGKVVASEGATAQIIRVKAGDTLAFTLNPTTTEYLTQGGYILTANGSNVAPDANGVYYIYNVHENIEISALPAIGKPEFDDDQQYDTDEVPEKSIFAKILAFFERIMDWFRNLFK